MVAGRGVGKCICLRQNILIRLPTTKFEYCLHTTAFLILIYLHSDSFLFRFVKDADEESVTLFKRIKFTLIHYVTYTKS